MKWVSGSTVQLCSSPILCCWCTFADWFLSRAIRSLSDSSLFVAASARDFLCACWVMECKTLSKESLEDGDHCDSFSKGLAYATLSHAAKDCTRWVMASLGCTQPKLPFRTSLSGDGKTQKINAQQTSALLGLLATVLCQHLDVPVQVVCTLVKSSGVLGAVLSRLKCSESPLPVSVIRQASLFIEALCCRTRWVLSFAYLLHLFQ